MHAAMVPDLPQRMAAAAAEIAARREPSLARYARWFEIYTPLLAPVPMQGTSVRPITSP
jgi:hypothetical protein